MHCCKTDKEKIKQAKAKQLDSKCLKTEYRHFSARMRISQLIKTSFGFPDIMTITSNVTYQ